MGWMLELSGVPASGWRGRARTKLLLGIYLSVLRVWFADDTADMTKTMAALDARLRRTERWLGLAVGGREEPAAGPASAPLATFLLQCNKIPSRSEPRGQYITYLALQQKRT